MPSPILLGENDKLYFHVLIDSDKPPKSLMLAVKTNEWHGVYFGEDTIEFCKNRQSGGPLPEGDFWQRLEAPIATLGLAGQSITGLALLQDGGSVYWDNIGVERTRTDEQLAPEIIQALGGSKAPNAEATLLELLSGKLATRLGRDQASWAAFALIAKSASTPGEVPTVHRPKYYILWTALFSPRSLLGEDATDAAVEDLRARALPHVRDLSATSPELRLAIAEKILSDASLPQATRIPLLDALLEEKDVNFAAQLLLFESGKLDFSEERPLLERFSAMSGAAFARHFGFSFKGGNAWINSLAEREKGKWLAAKVWSPKLRRRAIERVEESQELGQPHDEFLWVLTMPLKDARLAVHRHVQAMAGKEKAPSLEHFGISAQPLDENPEVSQHQRLIDPALLIALKLAWRRGDEQKTQSAATEAELATRQEELARRFAWAFIGSELAQHLIKQWMERADLNDVNRDLPLSLHPFAKIERHVYFEWPGEVTQRVPGVELDHGRLAVHVIRMAQPLTKPEFAKLKAHYKKTLPSIAYNGPLSEPGKYWIDALGHSPEHRHMRRSIDVFFTVPEVGEFNEAVMCAIDILIVDADDLSLASFSGAGK
jgi:hypothetical protein